MLTSVRVIVEPWRGATHAGTRGLRGLVREDALEIAEHGRVADLMIGDLGWAETFVFGESELVLLKLHFYFTFGFSYCLLHFHCNNLFCRKFSLSVLRNIKIKNKLINN